MKAGKWVIIAALLGLVLGTVPVVGQVTVVWGEDNELATLDPRITQSRHELHKQPLTILGHTRRRWLSMS